MKKLTLPEEIAVDNWNWFPLDTRFAYGLETYVKTSRYDRMIEILTQAHDFIKETCPDDYPIALHNDILHKLNKAKESQ